MIIIFQNFIYTTEAEQVLIWQWRNSDRVRRQMINHDFIELKDHLDWLTGLVHRSDCSYFLVYDDGKPIGTLSFTSLDHDKKTADWGFYLDLNTRPGFGVVGFLALEHFFNDWGFTELRSQVLPSNKKSHARHKELLFFELPSQIDAKSEIIRMRLSKENWLNNSAGIRERLFSRYPDCRAIWQE